MNKIKNLVIGIILINFLLVLYTFIFYGNLTNNFLFTICKNNIILFTLINIILIFLIKYYTIIKYIIKS